MNPIGDLLLERADGSRYAPHLHFTRFAMPGLDQLMTTAGVEHPDGRREAIVEFRGELHVDGERIPDCRPPELARRLHQIRDTAIRIEDPIGGGVGFGNCQPIAAGPWPELGLTDENWS